MSEPKANVAVDVHLQPDDLRSALVRDVRAGLTSSPKRMPPVWFYDDVGSQLFDEITRLPEYYLTRAERSILDAHARDIAELAKADTLVELGSGTSEKTRILLDALRDAGSLARFVPLDVSEQTLRDAAMSIASDYAGIDVHAVVGDFHRHLADLPRDGTWLVAFLGSTIGNLDPAERRRFLFDLDCAMEAGDRLLLGTDLVKPVEVLLAAYDDEQGVTARFNKNLLSVLNREVGATFEPERFAHVARWNADASRMEMWLRSLADQTVEVAGLGFEVTFAVGEEMRTEISSKFTEAGVRDELWEAGFVVDASWTDDEGRFLLTLARPYC
ncbi:MAG TPA: L-histidine N(alpha)-methyltransferase [Acidimicrobiales bacterium]